MPKPKGKLDALPDSSHEKLVGWLLGGMTYDKAVQVVNVEFGIVTSTRALGDFWQEYCEPRVLERRRGSARLASTIAKEAQESPEDFDQATVDLLRRVSFDMANAAAASPNHKIAIKDIKTLFTLVLKRRDQESKAKSLEFEKEKFRTSLLSKIETAMEALRLEVKDNPKALAAFNAMRDAIAKK